MSDIDDMATCDWCLQEAPLQTIEEELWNFWKIISTEDQAVDSHKKICKRCTSVYEEFSTYIKRCKAHATIVDEILSGRHIKTEHSIDVTEHPLIKQEIFKDEQSGLNYPTYSSQLTPQLLKSDKHIESSVCKKCLPHRSNLNSHLRYPTDEKPFKCSHCGKCYNCISELQKHLNVHMKFPREKRFKCSQCDKRYFTSSHLKTHTKIHTGERPFKCSLCLKSFISSSDLKLHTRIHTGNKPFKCSQCDKSFVNSSTLNIHMHIHTGEKPFICLQCDKRFFTANGLKNHTIIHVGKPSFKCSGCNKCFYASISLQKHKCLLE